MQFKVNIQFKVNKNRYSFRFNFSFNLFEKLCARNISYIDSSLKFMCTNTTAGPLLHEIKRGCTKANTTWFHYYDNNKDLCLNFQGQPENHLYDEYGSLVKYYLNNNNRY